MKFIVTGDWHFKGVNPKARLDDFQQALTRKIYEVYDLARQHRVEAIIVPGDLTDSPNTAWGTIAELGYVLKQAPCKVLAIHGNHDIWAGNAGSKHRTPFGMLARLGLIHDLSSESYEPYELVPQRIYISGHGFTVDTDTEKGKHQFNCVLTEYEEWEGPIIHVVHSMLLAKPPGFDMRHTLIDQVKTNANVIISGHEHLGFGIIKRKDGVLFINPGALCRLTAHPGEIERQVQVALLTVENGQAHAELIPLKSALPGHEVLSREHLEQEAERDERVERFLQLLAQEGESRFLEVREIVEDIAAREQLPEEVKKEALLRISRAREELGVTCKR